MYAYLDAHQPNPGECGMRNIREAGFLATMLIFLTLAPCAHAQQAAPPVVTNIGNLQYPSQISLQSGAATVTFSLNYTYLSEKLDYVVAWITDTGGTQLTGTSTSTPLDCMRNRDTSVFYLFATEYAGSLSCIVVPTSGSGTESFTFTIAYNSPGTHNLQVNAVLLETFIPLASDAYGNIWQWSGLKLFAVGQAQPVSFSINVTS
jgi:hypothetical protein